MFARVPAGAGQLARHASIGLFRLLGLPLGAQPGSVVEDLRDDAPVPARGALRSPARGWRAACGMAAAFSALCGAPLAGAAFALELVRFDGATARHLPAILAASLVAALAALPLAGGYELPCAPTPDSSWRIAVLCLLVGLASAAGGMLFGWAVRAARRTLSRVRAHSALVAAAGGALVCALVLAFGWQRFGGSGLALVSEAFDGHAQPLDFVVKALLTALALGFGFKGGEVMPALSVGALLGATCASALGDGVPFAAAMGAAAFFAAAARCPLAAVLLAGETFGWVLAPWAALAVAPAYLGSTDVGTFGRGLTGRLRRDRRRERER